MAIVNKTIDFLIVGVGKSGTTSLADMVSQHPDVIITDPKEPWFFDTNDYYKGMSWYWEKYLDAYSGERFVGEASSQTLFVPYAAKRLKETVPEAKLIVLLREPSSRAYSDWWMKYCTGLDKDNFETSILKNFDQIKSGLDFADPDVWQKHIESHKNVLVNKTYIEYGYYASQLENYLNYFSREQILVLLFDDLVNDPQGTTEKVWRFIGIEKKMALPNIDTRVKNPAMNKNMQSTIRTIKKTPVLGPLLKLTPLGMRKKIMNIGRGTKPQPPKEIIEILRTHYKDEIVRLGRMVDIDCSSWINK